MLILIYLKYGCCKASIALILLVLSNFKNYNNKLIASGSIPLSTSYGFLPLNFGKDFLKLGILTNSGHSDSLGVPKNYKILKI